VKAFALFKKPNGGAHAGVLIAYLFINGIALANAVMHDPRVGYDHAAHLRYINTLATTGHLQSFEQNHESFTPPLSYVLPALLLRMMAVAKGETESLKSVLPPEDNDPTAVRGTPAEGVKRAQLLLGIAAKFAQLLNWVFSIGLTLFVLKICELIKPANADFKFWTLLLLGMFPVYYKTFSFVRGEPLAAFLVVVAVYHFLQLLLRKDFSARRAITLGVVIGLAILSRQWPFFILPAFVIAAVVSWPSRLIKENKSLITTITAAVLIAVLLGGWFYLSFPWRHVRPGPQMGTYLRNVSGDPYWAEVSSLSFAVSYKTLFTNPVRDALANQIFSIFYAETWGDYWGYFVTTQADQSASIRRYLGRVNFVSLLPTAILLAGFGLGVWSLIKTSFRKRQDGGEVAIGLLALLVACSLIGYAYFLTVVPNTSQGAGLKASYMLQIFPFVALLGAGMLTKLRQKGLRWHWSGVALLVVITLHNLPAMITHYFITFGRPHLTW
jgi:hypothetical protein